jgi:hypothetical protein
VRVVKEKIPLQSTLLLVLLTTTAFGQSQFAGKWQTRRATKVTGQHSITVNIAEEDGNFTGTVVLVNPDRSEIQSPIINPKLSGKTIEFETKIENDTFFWRLTSKAKNKASLHGSMREMLIDEQMVKSK